MNTQEENDVAELLAGCDLRWEADQRAIKMWQAAHPERGEVWPDHADMVVWLLEEHDKLVQFAKDFLEWRNGPDGPEMICTPLGASLTPRAEELVKEH